jgi:polysaccharide chain length determinant protein (PEP-CTERM system associated)
MATMREYAGIAWRNKWLFLGCVTLSSALAGSYCVIAPQYYRSETLILAGEQTLFEKEKVAQGAGEGNFDNRLFIIQREIMNQNFLGEIAREFNPYPKELEEGGEAFAVLALTGAIKVEKVKTDFVAGPTAIIEGFTVSFIHQDPKTAKQVTARIAEKFIEENIKERQSAAEGALNFYDDELTRIKQELESKEDQITAFKKVHVGELPQHMDTNFRTLDKLESEINSVKESIQRHSNKLAMVEKAMQEYRLYGRQSRAFMTGSMEPEPLFTRLKELREKQIKLKAEFRDEYPEVILAKEELRHIEERLAELYGPEALKPDQKPRDPYLQDLVKQESEEKSELSLSIQGLETLNASRKSHERHVERSHEVEQDLLVLERDYGSMKANYATLLDKRLHARVAENMEKRKKNGKFRILDPANLPRAPSMPNRPKVLVLGLLFGCVLGVGLSVMREQLTPQFRGPEDVELLMGPQLLVAIPDFSFLWNQKNVGHHFKNSFLQRPLLRGTVGAKFEMTGAKWPQGHPQNDSSYERRFVTKHYPHSMAAEQYRVAAARLQLLDTDARSRVVTVTSAVKGEGKTTTVINLGYTLARDFGKRVLLLDCDFVFPELQCFSETPAQYGLVDCFRDNIPVEKAMTSFTDIPCWIMPAGDVGYGSSELLKTGPFERVLSQLREDFDYILINAPPILPVATMNVLERHTDLLLLVVRANLTSQPVVKRALDSLRASKPIHVILNCVPMQSLPNYMAEYSAMANRTAV